MTPPEEVGVKIASALLGEIEQGGVVDSTHQVRLFIQKCEGEWCIKDFKSWCLKLTLLLLFCRAFYFFSVRYVPKIFRRFGLESSHHTASKHSEISGIFWALNLL